MKNIKKLFLFLVIFGLSITSVFASGSASLTIEGNSSVSVNSNITLTLYVDNVSSSAGGVVSVGGTIKFDPTSLEYVSASGATTPYVVQKQDSGAASGEVMIAGIDNTMSAGITSRTKVFEITFKAKKEGSTTVTFENGELADMGAILSANFGSKSITVTSAQPEQPKSNVATLGSLSVSGYSISPAFDKNTDRYTLTVPNDATSITVAATATDNKAAVAGVGTKTLEVGSNNIAITVTAEDGTTKKTYTITVTREAKTEDPEPTKSNDATLKDLSVTGYSIFPKFDKDTTTYSLSVDNGIKSVDVLASATDTKANVTITGNTNLSEGVNAVKVSVVAEDGSTKVYTINVTRKAASTPATTTTPKKSSNNYLKSLTTVNGELTPAFKNTTSNYNIKVPYSVEKLDLKVLTSDGKAKYNITGNENFKVDTVNVVEVEVLAEDGSSRVYTINVTRSAKDSETKLKEINVDGGKTSLNPKFNPDTYEYEIEVDPKDDKVNISAIPTNDKSKVEITGNTNLQEGNNAILIKVTDENGFVQYYKINAHKSAKNNFLTTFNTNVLPWVFGGLFILLPLLLIIILLAKKKDKKEEPVAPAPAPSIEFKPEFNFSSKNGTDDDYVEAGGILNQSTNDRGTMDYAKISKDRMDTDRLSELPNEYRYGYGTREDKPKEIPYDPYDEVVTKDELIDAISEKDAAKLKILFAQEMLNREKEKLKEEREEENRKDDYR